MGISNLKWHKAMGEAGTFFSHDEKNEHLPKTLTPEQLAALQHPHIKGDTSSASKEATGFKNWIKSVCLNGDLAHTTTIEVQPLRNVGYQESLRRTLNDELDRVTIHHIEARAFAAVLANVGEEQSTHLTTWIEATASELPVLPPEAAGASVGVVELDYSVLATPAALLDAFEKWGMKAAWFDELDSHKWLLDARRKKGQGQRGNVIPPMFCPYAVMFGLVNKVRKATRLKPDTAWRTLAHKFPEVYAAFKSHDTRDRTGD